MNTKNQENTGYKVTGDFRNKWATASADLTQDSLKIFGHPVMERWETPFMEQLAKVATERGGKVLEIGFGLGISANAIQTNSIKEHHIVEANEEVYKSLVEFAKNSEKLVKPYLGNWETIISQFPDNFFDGILYDAYPLTDKEQHLHHFNFLREAKRILKPDGVMTYCNLTSWGRLINNYNSVSEMVSINQVPSIKECGFSTPSWDVFSVHPDENCQYYRHNQAPVIRITK